MRLVKDYMKDANLRHELNELTQATFYFNFESWVTNGYFEGDYIPYSFEAEGKILSNVSVNLMHFVKNGENRNYIQLGTVMTAEEYRKQGFARQLMEHVIADYKDKCDGIYLFANLGAVDFYKKLGFVERTQTRYTLRDDVRLEMQRRISGNADNSGFVKLDSSDEEAKKRYIHTVKKSVANGAFEQENKYGLQMFYTADMGNVYYSKDLDCYVVLEQDGEILELQSIISTHYVSLDKIIREIKLEYNKLRLGFTPKQEEINKFEYALYDGSDDYRLMCLDGGLECIEKERLYFPVLSHA